MFVLFFLLFLASLVAFFIGLFRPPTVIRWGNKRTRKRAALVYGPAAIILFIGSSIAASHNTSSTSRSLAVNSSSSRGNSHATSGENTVSSGPSVSNQTASSNTTSNRSNVVSTSPPSTNNVSTAPVTSSPPPETCRTNWSAGVYHTYRFNLLSSCQTASGIVETVRHEADHDYHLDIQLDPEYTHLLASGNSTYQHGYLVVEIIPMDQSFVTIPSVGEHITVTGAWVDDKDHGWNEIHPAWIVNGQGHTGYTAAAAQQSVITGICGNGDKDCPIGSKPSVPPTSSSSAGGALATASSTSSLSLVSSTLNVSPGSMASVEVKTKPGVQGTIIVEYSSGPSKSSSLYPKAADAQGYITWTWKVGTRTRAGDWPVTISADGKSIQVTLHVQ